MCVHMCRCMQLQKRVRTRVHMYRRMRVQTYARMNIWCCRSDSAALASAACSSASCGIHAAAASSARNGDPSLVDGK